MPRIETEEIICKRLSDLIGKPNCYCSLQNWSKQSCNTRAWKGNCKFVIRIIHEKVLQLRSVSSPQKRKYIVHQQFTHILVLIYRNRLYVQIPNLTLEVWIFTFAINVQYLSVFPHVTWHPAGPWQVCVICGDCIIKLVNTDLPINVAFCNIFHVKRISVSKF